MSAPGVRGPGIGLAGLHERLDEALQFYRAELRAIERRERERERDAEIAALLTAHRPWRMRAWLGVMP